MVNFIISSVGTSLKLERRCPHCARNNGSIHCGVQTAQKTIEYFQTQGRTQDAENIKYYLQQMQSQKPGNP